MAVDTVDKLFMGLGIGAIAIAGYLIVAQNTSGNDNAPDAKTPVKVAEKDPARVKLPMREAGKPLPKPTGDTPLARLFNHFDLLDATPEHTAEFVEVQHILIGFVNPDGNATVGGKNISRTKQQAKELVAELYDRALKGEDFGTLVSTYTNDSPPGIYGMVSDPSLQSKHPGSHLRTGMVPAFGNTGWRLQVGEIGVADFDSVKSPYGWHIVKRTK